MSGLEVLSWTLGKHLSELAWGELSVFEGGKAECPPMSLLVLTSKATSS